MNTEIVQQYLTRITYYVYDERSPDRGNVYETDREIINHAWRLHDEGKDWGMFNDLPVDEATAYDLAEILHGSWGRVRSIRGHRYMVRNAETGIMIESAPTLEAADSLIDDYETEDYENGILEQDFYEIYDLLLDEII